MGTTMPEYVYLIQLRNFTNSHTTTKAIWKWFMQQMKTLTENV